MNPPELITETSFQKAWLSTISLLSTKNWDLRNLIVHILNADYFQASLNDAITSFYKRSGLIIPKHVAYTIFPHGLYNKNPDCIKLYNLYNKSNGMYERLSKKQGGNWGTYFRRMTYYESPETNVNQLDNIIKAIKKDKLNNKVYRGAFSVIIPNPGGETIRRRGGPCLNYISVQLERESQGKIKLGLLCVYRNHDFLYKAYGNYWGLCNLLCFFAKETGCQPGPLTCISSRAYVPEYHKELCDLAHSLT